MAEFLAKPHFRKFSPIDREYPIFELVENDTIFMDITASNEGIIEVIIYEALANKSIFLEQLHGFLAEGQRLIETEMS